MPETPFFPEGNSPFSRWIRVVGGGMLIATFAACSRDTSRQAVRDSALDRDLTLASSPSVGTPPTALGDTATAAPPVAPPARVAATPPSPPVRTPASPPPRKAPPSATASAPAAAPASVPATVVTPAPAPPAPAPATEPAANSSGSSSSAGASRSLGIGTALHGVTASAICSLANRPGDKFVVTLGSDVVGPDGATLRAGTPIVLEMAAAEPPADFAFRVRGVQVNGQLVPVSGTVTAEGQTTDHRVAKGGDKGKVATGAIVGAILGRVLGGGGAKGTIIGAAGGAAAGTVMAQRNATVEHCLPAGAAITVTLASPLVLTGSAP